MDLANVSNERYKLMFGEKFYEVDEVSISKDTAFNETIPNIDLVTQEGT